MEFNISAQHTTLTPALEETIKEKFNRFQEHADKPLQAHVMLRIDSGQHEVEAIITGFGKSLVAKTKHKDMYAAINEASRMIDRQWRKQKTARLSARRKDSLKDKSKNMSEAQYKQDTFADNELPAPWAEALEEIGQTSTPKP